LIAAAYASFIQVLAVVVPFIIIAVISIVIVRSPLDLHNGTLGLLVSVSFTLMITEIVKVASFNSLWRQRRVQS
jgi:hypothetical protein